MYRRGDPRWNRTLQNISDTVEHANESAQEGLYSFAHAYVTPCLSSLTQCANACTAPCFPSHNDRRRHRAEQSFDFYDDWAQDEDDGLLGWGHDNLDRLWGATANYGTTSQPSRPRAMSYGNRNRNRDPRFTRPRRKSAVPPHDGGPDPTIIPSSSYFGFLGRLPFRLGGKVLRYRPSAADLTEHPGQARRSYDEARPLIEGSDDGDDNDDAEAQHASDLKTHGRKRSQTNASGHTTDSLSSRGDIFPSEDELDDAVPLDDEFAVALERRTTGPWHDDVGSGKLGAPSGSKSKRPSASLLSTKSISSRNTQDSGRNSHEVSATRPLLEPTNEAPALTDFEQEEEQLRQQEETEVHRRRQEAQQLALMRGLATDNQHLPVPRRSSPSPGSIAHPARDHEDPSSTTSSPFPLRSTGSGPGPELEPALAPSLGVDTQTMPDSSSFHVDESDYSSLAPTPKRPLSLKGATEVNPLDDSDSNFVPARLPQFDSQLLSGENP